jgi:hypothetical protein
VLQAPAPIVPRPPQVKKHLQTSIQFGNFTPPAEARVKLTEIPPATASATPRASGRERRPPQHLKDYQTGLSPKAANEVAAKVGKAKARMLKADNDAIAAEDAGSSQAVSNSARQKTGRKQFLQSSVDFGGYND